MTSHYRVLAACVLTATLSATGCAPTATVRGNSGEQGGADEINKSRITQAEQSFEKGKLAEALYRYSEILKQDPDNREALIAVGKIYAQSGKARTAEGYFSRVLEMHPGDAVASEERGLVLFKLDALDAASADFRNALKQDDARWRSWNALGIIADLNGNSADARAYYYRALQILPDSPTILNNIAYSLISDGEYAKAESMLRENLAADQTNVGLRNNLGMAVAWQGRYEDAVQIISAVLPEYAAMNNVGYVAMLRKDKDAAIQMFTKAIEMRPAFYVRAAQNLKKAEAMAVSEKPEEAKTK